MLRFRSLTAKFIALVLASALNVLPAQADDSISSASRVIDGDTLELDGARVRLHGIDAPEARQTCTRDGVEWLCGQEASKALREYLREEPVLTCERVDTDRYGRIVAKCFTNDGIDIGKWMVSNGWALAYRRYSTQYVSAETEAKGKGYGLWSGTFIQPWEWRRN